MKKFVAFFIAVIVAITMASSAVAFAEVYVVEGGDEESSPEAQGYEVKSYHGHTYWIGFFGNKDEGLVPNKKLLKVWNSHFKWLIDQASEGGFGEIYMDVYHITPKWYAGEFNASFKKGEYVYCLAVDIDSRILTKNKVRTRYIYRLTAWNLENFDEEVRVITKTDTTDIAVHGGVKKAAMLKMLKQYAPRYKDY